MMKKQFKGNAAESGKLNKFLRNAWSGYGFVLVFLMILIIYISVLASRGYKFNWDYFATIMSSTTCAVVGIIALGQALVIITGQIDLSVGSMAALVGASGVLVYNSTNGNVILALLTSILVGGFFGTINGLLVGKAKMPPFVVTLGTMLVFRSLANYYVFNLPVEMTGSSYKYQISPEFASYKFTQTIGTGKLSILGISIPYQAIVFILFVAIVVYISTCTKYGKKVYAVGSNEKAARLAGINTDMIKVSVFIITGVLTGIASMLLVWKNTSITPGSTAVSYEMYAIAAVVLGGISFSGGVGKLFGVFFGALSYSAIDKIIAASGLDVYIQGAAQGLVLIVVVLIQTVAPIISERIVTYRRIAKSAALEAEMKKL
jgi:ribose transport system permease protein